MHLDSAQERMPLACIDLKAEDNVTYACKDEVSAER